MAPLDEVPTRILVWMGKWDPANGPAPENLQAWVKDVARRLSPRHQLILNRYFGWMESRLKHWRRLAGV